jgi:hypothetical protein
MGRSTPRTDPDRRIGAARVRGAAIEDSGRTRVVIVAELRRSSQEPPDPEASTSARR